MDPSGPAGGQAVSLRAADRPGVLRPERAVRPGLGGFNEALIGFAVGLLVSSLAAGVAASIAGYHLSSHAPTPVGVLAAELVGLWVGLIGAAVYVSRTRGTRRLSTDFGYRIGAWWDLPVGAAIGVASQYGLIPLLYLPFRRVDKSLPTQLGQPTHQDTAAAHTSMAVAALLLLLALGAPLVEELFFRGLLLRSLLRRTPVPVAIVVDGLLFGLAHFEKVQFAGLALFGVILAILAWRTGRLGPSIGAHMAFNAVAVAAAVHLF